MKIREILSNMNILMDGVYRYAKENPEASEKNNVIKFSAWDSSEVQRLIETMFDANLGYFKEQAVGKTLEIKDLLKLKFKSKKVSCVGGTHWGKDKSHEELSVVEVLVIGGEEFLDMTVEEFIVEANRYKTEKENADANEIQRQINEFDATLELLGITYEQFVKLQIQYRKLNYFAVQELNKRTTLED